MLIPATCILPAFVCVILDTIFLCPERHFRFSAETASAKVLFSRGTRVLDTDSVTQRPRSCLGAVALEKSVHVNVRIGLTARKVFFSRGTRVFDTDSVIRRPRSCLGAVALEKSVCACKRELFLQRRRERNANPSQRWETSYLYHKVA